MRPLIGIVAVVLAGGSGASVRPVPDMPRPAFAMQGLDGPASYNATLLSKVMTRPGRVLSLDWTQRIPGVDGVGAGNNVFRVSIIVTPNAGQAVVVCSLDVACDAPQGDVTTTCPDAAYEAGADLDIRVTSQPCLGVPSGFPAFDAEL